MLSVQSEAFYYLEDYVFFEEAETYMVSFYMLTTVFMVFAMWLFPEVKREETAGGIRRETTQNRAS